MVEKKEPMRNQDKEDQAPGYRKQLRMTWIPLQAGCLTLSLSAIAILIGLLLDARLDTAPQWTLILLIASAPFALGGVFLLTRRALRIMRDEVKTTDQDDQD